MKKIIYIALSLFFIIGCKKKQEWGALNLSKSHLSKIDSMVSLFTYRNKLKDTTIINVSIQKKGIVFKSLDSSTFQKEINLPYYFIIIGEDYYRNKSIPSRIKKINNKWILYYNLNNPKALDSIKTLKILKDVIREEKVSINTENRMLYNSPHYNYFICKNNPKKDTLIEYFQGLVLQANMKYIDCE